MFASIQIEYHSILTVYKTLASNYPVYLRNKFTTDFPRNTRQASQAFLRPAENKSASLTLTTGSFRWRGIQSFNKLPFDLRTEIRLEKFKKEVKKWISNNIEI